MIIHLPADQIQAGDTPDLAQAIHNYFAYRLDVAERRLRLYFRDGRISLSAGLVFLFVCIALRQLVLAVGALLIPARICGRSPSSFSMMAGAWRE